jgi:hypothetical protein
LAFTLNVNGFAEAFRDFAVDDVEDDEEVSICDML